MAPRLDAFKAAHRRGLRASGLRVFLPHVHRFRFVGVDPFGAGSRYACRCGAVRPGL